MELVSFSLLLWLLLLLSSSKAAPGSCHAPPQLRHNSPIPKLPMVRAILFQSCAILAVSKLRHPSFRCFPEQRLCHSFVAQLGLDHDHAVALYASTIALSPPCFLRALRCCSGCCSCPAPSKSAHGSCHAPLKLRHASCTPDLVSQQDFVHSLVCKVSLVGHWACAPAQPLTG